MGILNTSGSVDVTTSFYSYLSGWKPTYPFVHQTANDRTYDMEDYGPEVFVEVGGEFHTGNLGLGSTVDVEVEVAGTFVPSLVVQGLAEALAEALGDFYSEPPKRNFVAWSKIGSVDFTLDRTNDAGFRQMPWKGWVYQVKDLGPAFVVYGEGGIAMMSPSDLRSVAVTFGFKLMSEVGILSKYAVCGNDKNHFALNKKGELIQISGEGLKVLGYAEFLLPMSWQGTPIVMTYDEMNQRVYITNGQIGYVYTPQGLTQGPKNLTSVMSSMGEVTVASPSTVERPLLEITTETIDFGSRDKKSLYQLTVSTYCPEALSFAVSYRNKITEDFQTTDWDTFDYKGEGFVSLSAVEFRIHLKAAALFEGQIRDLVAYYRAFDRTLRQEGSK